MLRGEASRLDAQLVFAHRVGGTAELSSGAVELVLKPLGFIICFLDCLGGGDAALNRGAGETARGAGEVPTAERLLVGAVMGDDRR